MVCVYCDICRVEIKPPEPPPKGGGRWVHEPYVRIVVTRGSHGGDEDPRTLEAMFIQHACDACASSIAAKVLRSVEPVER